MGAEAKSRATRWSLRYLALGYLALLLLIPVGIVVYETFKDGLQPVIDSLTDPLTLKAMRLTLITVIIAVPLNTIFGIAVAHALVREKFRGKAFLNAVIDLPFAISPVVAGLALILVYGQTGWFGDTLAEAGIKVIFSTPGIVMAVIFVSLPFVAREVAPVLKEIGTEQEEAASTLGAGVWQTFWRITLPSIKWAVSYGVVLTTARALGEFGAVAVVSGRISGQTETLPLQVQRQFEQFNTVGAYTSSLLLAVLALAALLAMNLLKRKEAD